MREEIRRTEKEKAIHVVNEARRCLHCKKPMCREGCPISTNIPEAIELFRTGHKEEAGEMLYENNPLSVICSLVCDHEKQCEGHCVLGRKGAPVHFSSIENYISDAYLDHLEPEMEPKKGQRVAIIGSGPAGITISVLLARRGYDVTIFESREKIGGVLRYGIPEFRLPKSILDRYQKQLIKLGIKIRPNTAIGRTLTVDDLQRDGYEAIFIGTGVWKPKAMGIPGESLGHVNYAIDYLVDPDVYDLGDNLVVIGAGNSAMDVARTALRKGVRHVRCFSRAKQVAASKHEFDYAVLEGVEFVYNKQPVEIVDEGVIFEDLAETEDGSLKPVPDSRKLYEASSTIISISQGPRDRIVSTTKGIEANARGLLITDEYGRTTRPGIFASGDVVAGARTVVEAVEHSKKVAQAMDDYMQGRETAENAD